jgi:metal-responsive CopG/Arc/MetJ family transcriptional regulator
MALVKRTYSLPRELVTRFEKRIASGERSDFVAKLVAGWLDEQEREELRRQVIAGGTETADLYSEIDQDSHRISDEVWREP